MQWLADNVTEVAVRGHWTNGQDVVFVLHVRREEDDPEQSARDVLNNVQDHLVEGVFQDNYTLDGARYVDHNEADGATGFIIPDPAKQIVGAGGTSTLPPNVSMMVKKHISGHLHHRAGRIYLPPPAEGNVDEDGVLNGAYAAAVDGILATFYDGISGPNDNELVVVHKVNAPTLSTVDVVTGLTVDPKVATQRRRLR